MEKLSEIMYGNERVVLFHGDEVIITWNRSCTFQAWGEAEPGIYGEISYRTVSDQPKTIEEAIEAAKNFYFDPDRTDERFRR